MQIPFYKLDGAGNDFVVVDCRTTVYPLDAATIAAMCHRRFGIGADGLMTLMPSADSHFRMVYYNSDGYEGTMCGNGGRCIAALAHHLGLGSNLRFQACDGLHTATIQQWNGQRGIVDLGMRSVDKASIAHTPQGVALDTGSPHLVVVVDGLDQYDVVGRGRYLRHNTPHFPNGANIDFVELSPQGIAHIRTYERGVEDETWACGTGVTACAIATGCKQVVARGGRFDVSYTDNGLQYADVHLVGPASINYTGVWISSVR